jgi:hypothetical protein
MFAQSRLGLKSPSKVGTATTADFTLKSGTITFPAGSPALSTVTIAIPVTPDSLDEANETFQVDLSSRSAARWGRWVGRR